MDYSSLVKTIGNSLRGALSQKVGTISDASGLKNKIVAFHVLWNLPEYLLPVARDVLQVFVPARFNIIVFENVQDYLQWRDEGSEATSLSGGSDSVYGAQLNVGENFVSNKLADLGYTIVKALSSPGEASILGDVVLFWPSSEARPVRVSLFGDSVEAIQSVDLVSKAVVKVFDNFFVPIFDSGEGSSAIVKSLWGNSSVKSETVRIVFIRNLDSKQISDLDWDFIDLGFRSIPGLDYYRSNTDILVRVINDFVGRGYKVEYITATPEKVPESISSIAEYVLPGKEASLVKGFVSHPSKEFVLTDYELFGKLDLRNVDGEQIVQSKTAGQSDDYGFAQSDQRLINDISPGDYVVHDDHGIAIFNGLLEEMGQVYFELTYAKKDRLLVPLDQSKKVAKYIGTKGKKPVLTTLNSGVWQRMKTRARKAVQDISKELIKLYAERTLAKNGVEIDLKQDGNSIEEFIQDFEFKDTIDQRVVTSEILGDLAKETPMDRLVVGDVGFGKTELAMRAAFAVVNAGKQVLMLAPTTILVEQHASVFVRRFKKWPIKVASMSRFLTKVEKEVHLADLSSGKIDILIGTHSLLSDAVRPKDLGLLIVDEEQKFGVEQKEKIKRKKVNTHVLTLTATPIPRSLNQALSGIRDISVLGSPPEGRKPIKNLFKAFEWETVQSAIGLEIKRKGQVYFLHNRVQDIEFVKVKLLEIFPDLRIGIAHGQMSGINLSRVMNDFVNHRLDLLVCTTIIENGIDLSNVNTLIVEDSALYGLSQLYQIRGRIGRSSRQAYAYFLYKNLRGDASLRLDALMEAADLGAGFLLANRDLEIRGAGDLLGKSQSGVIHSIGYGMYMNLLTQAVTEMKKAAGI